MKKGLSKISIILVALFAVTMITVLLIGTGIFNTPKQAAKKTLNSVKQILIKNVKAREKRVEDIIKNKVHLEGEADFKIDFPEKSQEILADFGVDKLIKALNDYTYEINATTDMKNDKANLVLGIKNQEGKKICFETLYNNKETYLNIEDVTDGYVDLEKNLDLFKYIKNYKTNKLSKSLDNFFEIIINELK